MREVFVRSINPAAEAALACGDLEAARRSADDALALVPGCFQALHLTVRAVVGFAQGELGACRA